MNTRHLTKTEQFSRYGIPLFTHRFYVTDPMPMHTHDFSELVMITDGEADHIIDGVRYRVKTGDVYILLGNLRHCFQNPVDLEVINIMFDCEELGIELESLISVDGFRTVFDLEPGVRKMHNFSSRLRVDQQQLRHLEILHTDLAGELERGSRSNTYIVKALLVHIFIYLARCYESIPQNKHQSLTSLSKVLTYMEKNYPADISLREISKMANMSKSTLLRKFHLTMGDTPLGYLQKHRLKKACELLENTETGITDIAYTVGFNSVNYFCRFFKQNTGLTPREYRRRHGDRTAVVKHIHTHTYETQRRDSP